MRFVFKGCLYISTLVGFTLLLINFYGLTQSMRPPIFFSDELRFGTNDIHLSKEQYRQAIEKRVSETDEEYAERLTKVIADGTAHIHWERYDPAKFNQRVPLWENWILHLMGRFSGIPEFERYHFVTASKSIERGIGICGDVSMLMTTLLENNGIEASIVTVPGHVMVTAEFDGRSKIFDPDFGVVLPYSAKELSENAEEASQLYVEAGYKLYDKRFFLEAFSKPFRVWTGPEHFITTKYYFEKLSYWLIWCIPSFLVVLGWFVLVRRHQHNE